MARFVQRQNVSVAWLAALETLLDTPHGDLVNLTVAIDDPTTEDPAIRSVVDAFNGGRRSRERGSVELVSTVANTVFPNAWYLEHLGKDAEEHLYKMERITRSVDRRRNRSGWYFSRMVAFPGPKGEFNQLQQVVDRLRSACHNGHQRGNAYEVGISLPEDETIAMPIVAGGKDRRTRGFPCLSHMSFSLHEGHVHLSALYRNHDFISRAYGNYLGLGRVLRFVAHQSGLPIGELTCMSSAATAEIGHSRGMGRGALEELARTARKAMGSS